MRAADSELGAGNIRRIPFKVAEEKFDWRDPFRHQQSRESYASKNLFQIDQTLIQEYYRRYHGVEVLPIATDQFLNKSKDEYSAPWLVREITQNFVDHNNNNPGTLDGVGFKEERVGTGQTRFTVEGNWEFKDPTGLLALHSDKPADFETAGGNGIGIKQTAIRFLRDFGVKKFTVHGNGWDVTYELIKAAEIRSDWEKRDQTRWRDKSPVIRHDWLIAKIAKAPARPDRCAYIIETNNPEATAAIRQFPTLGVSESNPFLQNPDYTNPHGAIKWFTSAEEKGRLFVNGQVMQYQEKGLPDNFWTGTEGVSIALKNIKYRMNIDKPPVSRWDLNTYLSELVSNMTKDEIIAQLRSSEHLWSQALRSEDSAAFNVLLSRMTFQLLFSDFKKEEYATLFPDRKYLHLDRGVSENQVAELEAQGFTICPDYFSRLGMPATSSKLSSLEQASNQAPISRNGWDNKIQDEALKEGVLVDFLDISQLLNIKSPIDFFQLLKNNLASNTLLFEELPDKPNTFRIKLNISIPKELLAKYLWKQKNEIEKTLIFIRGAIFYGLNEKIFKKAFTSQGEYVTTYRAESWDEDKYLTIKNNQSPNDLGTFLEFDLDADNATILRQVLTRNLQGEQEVQIQPAAVQSPPAEENITTPNSNSELAEKFNSIPIVQHPPPTIEMNQTVLQKKIEPTVKTKLQRIEKQLPALRQAVEMLDNVIVVETEPSSDVPENDPIKKYVYWRTSGKFYEVAKSEAGYLTGKHLVEIIAENTQADIAVVDAVKATTPAEQEYKELNERLKSIANRRRSSDEQVDEFDIVVNPTPQQLAQIALLRSFVRITTDVILPNDLFLYRGTGSRGINLGQKAIGIHEALFREIFNNAEGTLEHEICHNHSLDHDLEFIRALQSIAGTTKRKLLSIIDKQAKNERLTDEEATIVDIQATWDKLRAKLRA